VAAFSGLAENQRFLETVKGLGAQITWFEGFDDHHVYDRKDVEMLNSLKRRTNAEFLITTEKDQVKLKRFSHEGFRPWVLRVRFCILENEDSFFKLVMDGLI